MTKRITLVACACLALLAGCATLQPGDASAPAPTPAAPTVHPGMEWLDIREGIARSLADRHSIGTQPMNDGALMLRLPAADGFAHDSAEPAAALLAALDAVAVALAAAPDTEILVLGHTDSIGSELYNLRLSIRRAEAVLEYLRARGVALSRLSADGRGESEPIASNRDRAGRAVNRRVEIIVRPLPPRDGKRPAGG